MLTIANTAQTRKPTAFFAQYGLHAEQSGVLIKPGNDVLFFNTETRQFTTITPDNSHLLVLLQEVCAFMAQYYKDLGQAREERRALTTASALEVE